MLISEDECIDWFRIIIDLERSGYPHVAIGAAVGVSKRAVGGWKDGSKPRFEDGCRLIALWANVTGKGQESAPKVGKYSHHA